MRPALGHRGMEKGGQDKILLQFPWGESGGDERRARKPGVHPQPSPRAAPAGRKRSLCGCNSHSCPFSTRRGAGRAVSSAPFKFWGVELSARLAAGFHPEAGYQQQEDARPRPRPSLLRPRGRVPLEGALLRGIFQPGSPTSHPFTWSRAGRSEGPIQAAPPFPGPA